MFHDAGAEVLFVDAPQSLEELERIGRELPEPLLANMSETGKTPLLSANHLQALGFGIALFPSNTVRLAVKTVSGFLADLQQTVDSTAWISRMASLAETNTALEIDAYRDFEAKFRG